ncbi:PAS domain-containing protein [Wolbachia endosymbiont of Ctenocephalides felis wCfeT]|uniref:PAS domain-containing protein n=1 Tax=Wolbachia endosymbiont of Ctenocephalides felis wCfeT TaxID=2732593 RepID=UPI00144638B5|nr:PAS domain-containing protein [Wolbachia endosymbiont of Ctenocephalides felis wCfeT]
MESYVGKERRIANVVTQHWSDIKGSSRNWPARHEIDTAEIMESWQNCFIIEVSDQGYICENAGEKASFFYGFKKKMCIDNKYTIDAPFLRLYKIDSVIDKFDTIVDSKYLIHEEEESEGVKMRQVLLPLGDEKRITHILGVITFKLFDDI